MMRRVTVMKRLKSRLGFLVKAVLSTSFRRKQRLSMWISGVRGFSGIQAPLDLLQAHVGVCFTAMSTSQLARESIPTGIPSHVHASD
jgi:hypothetical protein